MPDSVHAQHRVPSHRATGVHGTPDGPLPRTFDWDQAGQFGRHRIVFVEAASAMGGVEFSTLYLAQHLDRSRWDPLVICPEEGDLPDACRSAGVPVHVLPRPAARSTSVRLGNSRRLPNPLAWAWNARALVGAARGLSRFLAQDPPVLIVTKGMFPHFYGGLAARWLAIPTVWHVQDFISERFWGIYRRAFGQIARWLPTKIIVDGSPIARQLPERLQTRVRVIYNGVDTHLFRPSRQGTIVRREMGIPSDALVIGHVARMTPWKGQHYLLEAFARIADDIPRALLLLVGAPVFDSDAYERRLRSRTLELGLGGRVLFAGYRRDLPRVLAAMDVFGFTSVEKDTTPLALLSAMAVGLPLVAFDIEGVREVVSAGDEGLLVPVHQIEPLAQALASVIQNDGLRRQLAMGARRRVEEAFSLEQYVSRFEEAFLAVVNG
jgi:glycosyltransferase involved in cell wall biosynthesis